MVKSFHIRVHEAEKNSKKEAQRFQQAFPHGSRRGHSGGDRSQGSHHSGRPRSELPCAGGPRGRLGLPLGIQPDDCDVRRLHNAHVLVLVGAAENRVLAAFHGGSQHFKGEISQLPDAVSVFRGRDSGDRVPRQQQFLSDD